MTTRRDFPQRVSSRHSGICKRPRHSMISDINRCNLYILAQSLPPTSAHSVCSRFPHSASTMSSPTTQKRPADDNDHSVSPPPLKRKAQSAITSMIRPSSISPDYVLIMTHSESAVANFFTPTSQKPKDRTTWSERPPAEGVPATLLVGKYVPEKGDEETSNKRRKVAAFDLVRNIIAYFGKDLADAHRTRHSSPRLRAKSTATAQQTGSGGIEVCQAD